jgi:aromatic-L-amino-acid decarboxylase
MQESLDPEDWESLHALGRRMVDDTLASLRTVRERPAWQPIPVEVRERLNAPVPVEGESAEAIYAAFQRDVLPYPTGNIHPRFWGWVMGTGSPIGVLAELLAAGMNCNVGGFDDAATLVEDQVIDWLKAMMGFPENASGLLVSGGSMANLVGLSVARSARAGFDVRREGLRGGPPLSVYASKETHSSNRKALELLGLGTDALRLIPVNADYQVDVAAMAAAIAADRTKGRRPIAVIGNAGTVNTGATDDLAALAELCAGEGLWLHVDGAFGALAALAPELKGRLEGIERADSLAFDLHKWGYVPIEVGVALVRDPEAHRSAFGLSASGAAYLAPAQGGLASRAEKFSDYGIQLSRGFRALKVWMCFKEQGTARLGRLIRQNVAQAQHLKARVEAQAALELLAPVPLNVVCFRYRENGLAAERLDALNERILVRLQEEGIAVPSHTRLGGRYAIRVAITNHRSRLEDFDALVDSIVRLGREEAR